MEDILEISWKIKWHKKNFKLYIFEWKKFKKKLFYQYFLLNWLSKLIYVNFITDKNKRYFWNLFFLILL